jgi:hypothetical protein
MDEATKAPTDEFVLVEQLTQEQAGEVEEFCRDKGFDFTHFQKIRSG